MPIKQNLIHAEKKFVTIPHAQGKLLATKSCIVLLHTDEEPQQNTTATKMDRGQPIPILPGEETSDMTLISEPCMAPNKNSMHCF